MKKAATFILVSLLVACTSDTDSPSTEFDDLSNLPEIITETLFTTGGGDDFFFGSIADVQVLSDGTIAVLDGRSLDIHLLNGRGEWIKTHNLEGRGPGEVQNLTNGIKITPDDYLAVRDYLMFKISIFQSSGTGLEHIRDVIIEESIGNFFLDGKDQLILKKTTTEDLTEPIAVMDLNGSSDLQTVLEFPAFERLTLTGSMGGMSFTISNSTEYHAKNEFCYSEGLLYHIRTDSVGFTSYRLPDGEEVSSSRLYIPALPLSDEEKEEVIDGLLASGGDLWGSREKERLMSEMPGFKPSVNRVVCDLPEGIWLQVNETDNPEGETWILMSDTGEVRGSYIHERDSDIVSFHRGHIFKRITDDFGDISMEVHRYILE